MRFRLTDLGVLGTWGARSMSSAFSLDQSGTAVGWSNNAAVIFDSSGTTPMALHGSDFEGEAHAINDSRIMPGAAKRRIVGWANTCILDAAKGRYDRGPRHAAVWEDNSYLDLHTKLPFPVHLESVANDVTDTGYVVGCVDDHPFLFNLIDGECEFKLLPDNNRGEAYAINFNRTIAGVDTGSTQSFFRRSWAFRRDWDGTIEYFPTGDYSVARGIDPAGRVVGWLQPTAMDIEKARAFVWEPGQPPHIIHRPDARWSQAYSINVSGDVVGMMGFGTHNSAFLYRNGRMWDLNELAPEPGWEYRVAMEINDAGQIVGWGLFGPSTTQSLHAFLLTPVKESTGIFSDINTLVGYILGGAAVDGGGHFVPLGGGPPIPVGPGPGWNGLSPDERDMLIGLIVAKAASLAENMTTREEIQRAGYAAARAAIERLMIAIQKNPKS